MITLTSPGATAEILRRLMTLKPETRAQWGRMNAHQMLCHLNDSFALAMGEKQASEQITLFSRTIMRWGALRLPMKWPPGVPTRPEMDQLAGGTPPVEFEKDRSALIATVQRFAAQPRDFSFGRHPIFAEMSDWEWMRWGYLHADHHLRQFGL